MTSYRCRLPHIHELNQPIFLTWRLEGSLPPNRHFTSENITAEKSFLTMDRLLDEAQNGPLHLLQAPIAELIVALLHSPTAKQQCTVHAFVVMPNHVHLLLTPHIELPKLTQSIKGYSARKANQILGKTGTAFWQKETYDHQIRDPNAFHKIQTYIEQNPVKAGLAINPTDYKYSSAHLNQSRSQC